METGEQYTDLMELHVLELKKLPPEDQNENGVIRWIRFLCGKNRKEYEVRQKTVRDHNSQMKRSERRGKKIWIEIESGMKVPLFFYEILK